MKALAVDRKSEEEVKEIEVSINLSAVAVESFKNLATWRQMMPTFESSATLLEILDKILGLVPRNPDTSHETSEFATRVLSERWSGSNAVKVKKNIFYIFPPLFLGRVSHAIGPEPSNNDNNDDNSDNYDNNDVFA